MDNMRRMAMIVTGTLLTVAGYAVFCMVGPDSWVFRQQFEQSRQLIAAVDAFRASNGHIPDDREAQPILEKMPWYRPMGCPCYEKQDENRYIVSFQGKSVGDSFTYESDSRQWHEGG